jgi:hypothetical protein
MTWVAAIGGAGKWLAEKGLGLLLWKLKRARLEIVRLAEEPKTFVLPEGYATKEVFPKQLDASPTGSLTSFRSRSFVVRNHGRQDTALECEVIASLTCSAGVIPVEGYWNQRAERDLVSIPPGEEREFVVFLADPTDESLLFSSALCPDHRETPCWQLRMPIRAPFVLRLKVQAATGSSEEKEFFFTSKGDRVEDLQITHASRVGP